MGFLIAFKNVIDSWIAKPKASAENIEHVSKRVRVTGQV
jgi:hypothetical protein